MYPSIAQHCRSFECQFNRIPEKRKEILAQLALYVQQQHDEMLPIRLVFVCTHNSRRSHFGQIWGAVAANYYHIRNVFTYSAGTESTAFHPHAIAALRSQGFDITVAGGDGSNPEYRVAYGENDVTHCFSKVVNHAVNPTEGFAAVMTCGDADENCPLVPGTSLRISITYDDPKAFDDTPRQSEAYLERSAHIATEMLYVFSLIR
jgi:arsenate reductase